jgi:ribosomal protein S18 acetylase RimI-like enzyme
MQPTETVTTISSAAGELRITRATMADYDTVMRILREAAAWLTSRGNPQWEHWYLEAGESMLRERIDEHEVYLASLNTGSIATVTVQWTDTMVWGAKGADGLAGYIHGLAISRSVAGFGVGERMLEWTIGLIAARGRRYARLDCIESNLGLCRYYNDRGFTAMGTAMPLRLYARRLFEREIAGF